ncbi:MAG: T9SS type A sorting domain-containing protein [Bacteroidota bacterium]
MMNKNLCFFILLLCLVVGSLPALQANASPKHTTSRGTLIGEYVSADGRLTIPKGFSGVLDTRGFSISLDECEGPIALPMLSTWGPLGNGVVGGSCRALAIGANGELFAGGFFTTAGGQPASRIAKWDGSGWTPLGSGLAGPCFALAIGTNGELFAGGSFTTAGGQPANRIAKWDGTSWTPLGSGLNNSCNALAIGTNGELFAGGSFTTAGGQPASRIAKWDGSTWSTLGAGVNNRCNALAIGANGELFAAGEFTAAGGQSASRIAKWDGSSWTPLGNGFNDRCDALAIGANGELFVGGFFTQAGGQSARRIAKWDGSSWTRLGNGLNEACDALAIGANGELFAGGRFTQAGGQSARRIAKWDGSSWTPLGNGFNDRCFALAMRANGEPFAGGFFTQAGTQRANGVALFAPPPPCDITITNVMATPETCAGENDGTITINASCTTCASILYSIDGGMTTQLSNTFEDLPAGTYLPYVEDSGNDSCNDTAVDEVIDLGATLPAEPVAATASKTICASADLTPSLANTGINVSNSLSADEKVVWVLTGKPDGSAYAIDDEFTTDNCGDPFKNFGELAVANSSKVIRVQDVANAPEGTYTFDVFIEDCTTACTSELVSGFSITINTLPTVEITSDLPIAIGKDICLGTMGVQYNAVVTSTDGGTYSYDWCAYNSGDGSGTCFGGFSDNTVQMPTRNWTSSAGPKSVGVTVTSDVAGCTAEMLYSFNVVAPPMVECPEDQLVTLVTNPGTFECETPVMFTNPTGGTEACGPYTLAIAIDGGDAEMVTPGEEYTLMVEALGVVEVSYTLTDGLGRETTCSFDVIVNGLPCGLVDNGGIGCDGSTAVYDQGAASFSLTADCAPNTMLYVEDASAFVFTELCGDGEITAQVTGLSGTGFAGVMMRETEAPNAKKVALGTNTVDRLRKEVRVIDGYPSSAAEILSFSQFWVRVVRSGDAFSAFASTDGVFWQPYVSQVVIMDECIVVGLFTYSEKDGNAVTATFSDVAITGLDLAGSGSSATVNLGANLGGFATSSQANLQGLSIYPNPAVSEITLDLGKFEGQAADIRIINQMGQLMSRTQIEEVQFNEVVDVSKLNAGVYNVMVKVGNEVVTERVVIARP